MNFAYETPGTYKTHGLIFIGSIITIVLTLQRKEWIRMKLWWHRCPSITTVKWVIGIGDVATTIIQHKHIPFIIDIDEWVNGFSWLRFLASTCNTCQLDIVVRIAPVCLFGFFWSSFLFYRSYICTSFRELRKLIVLWFCCLLFVFSLFSLSLLFCIF